MKSYNSINCFFGLLFVASKLQTSILDKNRAGDADEHCLRSVHSSVAHRDIRMLRRSGRLNDTATHDHIVAHIPLHDRRIDARAPSRVDGSIGLLVAIAGIA